MGKLTVERKDGDSVVIDGKIHIKVFVDKKGNPKLVITAPNDINIVREEIMNDEQRELGRRNGLPV